MRTALDTALQQPGASGSKRHGFGVRRALARRAATVRPPSGSTRVGGGRGYYSEHVHEAFTKAGFYRILQPRMFGGYEFDMTTYYRLAVEIGHGGSAGIAWCLDLGTHHSIILASHWPEQAQREIFSECNGHFVCGHRAGVGGTARKDNGGYRISGRWRYSSGVPYATHHMVGVRIESEEPGPPGPPHVAVVRRDQV